MTSHRRRQTGDPGVQAQAVLREQATPTSPAPGSLTPKAPASEPETSAAAAAQGSSGQRVLVVADEWLPAKGGLSAMSRYLCRAFAALGLETYCLVPEPSAKETADAEAYGYGWSTIWRQSVTTCYLQPGPDALTGRGRPGRPGGDHFGHTRPDQRRQRSGRTAGGAALPDMPEMINRLVVPVRNGQRHQDANADDWCVAITMALDTLDAAFTDAATVRAALAEKRTWRWRPPGCWRSSGADRSDLTVMPTI